MFKNNFRIFLVLVTLTLAVLTNQSVSARPEVPPTKSALVIKPTATPEVEGVVYPTCDFGPLKQAGPAPLAVHFDASASKNAVEYSWFTADNSSPIGNNSSVVWDHVFANIGTFKVRLTVWSAEGFNYSCSTWVTVTAPLELTPVVTPPAPVVTPTAPITTSLSIETNHDGCDDQVSKVKNSGTVIVICKNEGDIIINPPPDEETKEAELSFLQKIGLYLANLIKAFFGLK